MKREKSTKSMTVVLQPSLYEAFEKRCNEEYRNVSEIIRELMSKYIRGRSIEDIGYPKYTKTDSTWTIYKRAENWLDCWIKTMHAGASELYMLGLLGDKILTLGEWEDLLRQSGAGVWAQDSKQMVEILLSDGLIIKT